MPSVNVHLPRPHPAQAAFAFSNTKRVVVCAGKRSGKTTGAAVLAINRFLNGERVLYASPVTEQVTAFWRIVTHALRDTLTEGVFRKNEVDRTIVLVGSPQRLKAKTCSDAASISGDPADLLILDEWQLGNEDAWNLAGSSILLDTDGDAILLYTPPSLHGKPTKATDSHFVSKLYKSAAEEEANGNKRWLTVHMASSSNPFISTDALSALSENMSVIDIRQELDAEDLDEVILRTEAADTTSDWSPHEPSERQRAFLDLDCTEALYGGAAGGGKTDALLMAALQYVNVPGYAAILFRRTYQDLALPGAIMDRANEWLRGSGAKWSEADHRWTFPSGATVSFGYLQTDTDRYRYQGAEVQFVGFDELTQFSEVQYRYLFSRLRRLAGSSVPIRMRAASNPGGIGHEWVKQRFVNDHDDDNRLFVPARLIDNPHLDYDEYLGSLNQLDAVTRAQLLEGNWDVLPSGNVFKREWFGSVLSERPTFLTHWVRYWDKASTEDGGDYTAGVLIGRGAGLFYVIDVQRGQWSPAQRKTVVEQVTQLDAGLYPRYSVWMEQEPGSGGKESAMSSVSDLAGYDVHAETVTGSKVTRANPFAAQCEVGNVKLVAGAWNSTFLSELCAFPDGPYDDQVDAAAGAFAKLAMQNRYEAGSVKYA